MSDPIKHECGIAVVRLLKPLEYYEQKYGTPIWGFQKLFLLMEKQHNRGQDGVGVGCVKLNMPAGQPYMHRSRELRKNPLDRLFTSLNKDYTDLVKSGKVLPELPDTVKENFEFGGELLIGHLRYGTSGNYTKNALHPYIRRSNWPTRNLMVAGNFNMTNLDQLNQQLIERGQHPIFGTDTQTVLEEIGFYLDEAHSAIYHKMRDAEVEGQEIPELISRDLDIARIVRKAGKDWDGGYTIGGLIGNGDAFVVRDPMGIRPCHYVANDEIVAFASERVALMTILNQDSDQVHELEPGKIAVVKHSGEFAIETFKEPEQTNHCAFERIYFSRGNDPEIYRERRLMGEVLCDQVFDHIEGDFANTVFSYIPNTAEIAYYGLLHGMRMIRRKQVKEGIKKAVAEGNLTDEILDELIIDNWPRSEKIAHKDIKLRTFISQERGRNQMASHVYDITYNVVTEKDHLVCIDDSIVRGTTLKRSIIRMLGRTKAKQILICSTAPQIRYPDCYGIDMSELGKFIAFQAAVELLKDTGKGHVLQEVYQSCITQQDAKLDELVNHVKRIYEPFSTDQISEKIAELVRPTDTDWEGKLTIVYQKIEDLKSAIPNHTGDWYFTGDYPTSGGLAVLNQAYINYYENRQGRSY